MPTQQLELSSRLLSEVQTTWKNLGNTDFFDFIKKQIPQSSGYKFPENPTISDIFESIHKILVMESEIEFCSSLVAARITARITARNNKKNYISAESFQDILRIVGDVMGISPNSIVNSRLKNDERKHSLEIICTYLRNVHDIDVDNICKHIKKKRFMIYYYVKQFNGNDKNSVCKQKYETIKQELTKLELNVYRT